MNDFKELLIMLEKFRDERDWGQFHDSKNLALALSIEAAELNELFLWKNESDSEEVNRQHDYAKSLQMFLLTPSCWRVGTDWMFQK